MIPTGTIYRIAASGQDYKRARSFFDRLSMPHSRLSFPTILAERDDNLVGALATNTEKRAVIAGPLAIDVPGNPAFVGLRLLDLYDSVMREVRVKQYLFFIDETEKDWIENIEDVTGLTPYTREDGKAWFKRDL